MQSTVNKRIKQIAATLYDGNISAMAKATFINRTTLSSILGEKEVAPGYDVIRKIAEISSPKINLEWLIVGSGDMFITSLHKESALSGRIEVNSCMRCDMKENTIVFRLIEQLEEKDRQIAARDKQISELIDIIRHCSN